MSAQGDGEYAEALENYEEALKLEEDAYDRSYILYTMGLIHASNGEHERALSHTIRRLNSTRDCPRPSITLLSSTTIWRPSKGSWPNRGGRGLI
jgi:tetratricopeptide (TPR) repeat protein